jgi:uncharacterized protein
MTDIRATKKVVIKGCHNGEKLQPSGRRPSLQHPSVSMRVGSSLIRSSVHFAAAVLFGLAVVICGHQSKAASSAAEKTTAEANAAMIRGAYDAFSRGDIVSVFAIFAEDILWHVPGRGPLSREYRGHSDVQGFFEQFMGLSGGTFRIRIDEILAKGDRVVVLCTETAQRAGRTWASPQVHVWTMKDGRAIAFWEFEGDQQGEDEFWSIRD